MKWSYEQFCDLPLKINLLVISICKGERKTMCLNLKKLKLFCLFSTLVVFLSMTFVPYLNANPIMNVIEEKENFDNIKNNYFSNGNLDKLSFIKSTDFWDTLKYIIIQIINLADFLYKVIEPFIIILFTVLYTLNPILALVFIMFALSLRLLSMIEIDSEAIFSLIYNKKSHNITN